MKESIHITRWGTESPAVVMVHGGIQGSRLSGSRHFPGQERLAQRGWRIIVPDRPGHGQSPSPGRPDDIIADAQWVMELLGEGAHLVGHSFGGAIGLAAASFRPNAVRSLTLIEPALQGLTLDDPNVKAFVEKQTALVLSNRPPNELALEFLKMLRIPSELRGGPVDPEEMTRIGQALLQMKMPPPSSLKEFAETVARAGIPVLVVTGDWNPALEAAGDAAATLTNGRRHVIKSSHHFPQLISDEFNDLLNTFMLEADRARR
jgi:pimeloyl-ACP methyl ester carboxylesterase